MNNTLKKADRRMLDRAAAALDATHAHAYRGPKTMNARDRLATALDNHIATGRRLPNSLHGDVRHLEFVIKVEKAREALAQC